MPSEPIKVDPKICEVCGATERILCDGKYENCQGMVRTEIFIKERRPRIYYLNPEHFTDREFLILLGGKSLSNVCEICGATDDGDNGHYCDCEENK